MSSAHRSLLVLLLALLFLLPASRLRAVSLACFGDDAPGLVHEVGAWEAQGWRVSDSSLLALADDGTVLAVVQSTRQSGVAAAFAGRGEDLPGGGTPLGPAQAGTTGGLLAYPVLSGDGSRAFGLLLERRSSGVTARAAGAWRTADGRVTALPFPPGALTGAAAYVRVVAAHYDGDAVVGSALFPGDDGRPRHDAVLWDVLAGTAARISPLPFLEPVGMSVDARVIVGNRFTGETVTGASDVAQEAVVLTAEPEGGWRSARLRPPIPYRAYPSQFVTHRAVAISADGRFVAGTSQAPHPGGPDFNPRYYTLGWIWSETEGFRFLGDVPASWLEPSNTQRPQRFLDGWLLADAPDGRPMAVDPTGETLTVPLATLLREEWGIDLEALGFDEASVRVTHASPNAATLFGRRPGTDLGAYLLVQGTRRSGGAAAPTRAKIKLPACRDGDADGLCTGWEEQGYIDLDADGRLDPRFDLPLPGADPLRKDLYVEVDRVRGAPFSREALVDVQRAFAEVPNALVRNPGGRDGIALHLQVDEEILYEGEFRRSACDLSPDFRRLRRLFFGSAEERAASPAVLAAKQLLVRYALVGNRLANGSSSGIGDLPGNDFLVLLEGFSGDLRRNFAGTFMHELGHTLGLGHGGVDPEGFVDDTNFKPNHPSVMNYLWQLPYWSGAPTLADRVMTAAWRLDYSRAAWPTLDETALDEGAGIGGAPFRITRIGPPEGRIVLARGPVDFDGDGALSPQPTSADANRVRAGQASSPGELLDGSDDWSHVARAGFCGAMRSAAWEPENVDPCAAGASAARGAARPVVCGIGPEEAQALRESRHILDCDGDGADDEAQLAAGLAADADADGILDVCEAKRGDLDGDGRLDAHDWEILRAAEGLAVGDPGYPPAGDLDADGLVTRDDAALWATLVYGTTECSDGLDNDGDGRVDHREDPGCASPLARTESPDCDDGVDEDGDGRIDWDDPDCRPELPDSERPIPACGLGPELAALVPLVRWLRRRRTR